MRISSQEGGRTDRGKLPV